MTSEQRPYLAVLKALYDYEPTSGDEVAIKEDQLLFLLEKTDDEWWTVKPKTGSQDDDNGPSGLIPANYAEEATPLSTVKALYDYEAATPGELSIKEDEVLYVYGEDEEWLLVKASGENGLAGYVPGNYIEQIQNENDAQPIHSRASQIAIPDSPPTRPVSEYIDPADRVAATADKAKVDDIRTWSISEVDKKGKKKKGTLGIGNGSIFFASESDKTPVQKWQTTDINDSKVEKNKHLYIEIGGPNPASLHFNVGGKDVADQIVEKLESSRRLTSTPSITHSPSPTGQPLLDQSNGIKAKKAAVSVHFAPSPAVIPDPETPVEDDGEGQEQEQEQERTQFEGEEAVVIYDFTADGDDELTVKEGEQLFILDKVTSEEWWKCRNLDGVEGVVPASYIEIRAGGDEENDEESVVTAREQAQRAEIARQDAIAEAKAKARAAELEAQEKQRKDAERKAKAAAAAAQAEKERREREREERARLEQEKEMEREREKQLEREKELEQEKERERARARVQAIKKARISKDDSSKSAGQQNAGAPLKFPREDRLRIWRDLSAQWQTQAEFLGIHKGKIRLHKVNGVVIEVPPEKMSVEDVRYIESLTGQKLLSQDVSPPPAPAPQRTRSKDEDDVPLGALTQQRRVQDTAQTRPPKKSNFDWFEFFLNAGCEIDDCTRYASAFERDKIDEIILPDIKESTLRSLGLREGDIIRVVKAIEQRQKSASPSREDNKKLQLARDEELARALQAEEDPGTARGTPPNLFTGPGGTLKNQPRRGRPQPKGTAPPVNVDVNALSNASEQISRTTTPLISSPVVTSSASQSIAKTSTPKPSGFDDDAWTNRPSSTKPTSAPPPASVPAAPVAPTPPPPPPPPPPAPAPAPVSISTAAAATLPASVSAPAPTQPTQGAVNQGQGQFELLAKISQLRPPSAPLLQTTPVSPPAAAPPPSFHAGLGVGSSPLSLGQHFQNQQTGLYQPPSNGPQGPLAPVPGNQGLLNPLIPARTGFNHFIPTRPSTNPPPNVFASPPPIHFQQQQPSSSPFGGPGVLNFSPPQNFGSHLLSQPTGFASLPTSPPSQFPSGLAPQPTGFGGGFGNNGFGPNGVNGGFQPQPTGFNPALFLPPSQSAPPAPTPQKDVSPAAVFAQMKSGTFINDDQGPQSADKYDALRAQPTGWFSQGTTGGY